MALKRIQKELREIRSSEPVPGLISLGPDGEDFFQWTATILGPVMILFHT